MGGVTPIEKCLSAFIAANVIDEYVITCRKEDESAFKEIALRLGVSPKFVEGGSTRSLSVKAGLNAVTGEVVVIHDGARPFVSPEIIRSSVSSAEKFGSGVAVVPAVDTICDCEVSPDGVFGRNSSRQGKYLVQTPQTFDIQLLKAANKQPYNDGFTDDASVVEAFGFNITLVDGNRENIKITTPYDLKIAEVLIG